MITTANSISTTITRKIASLPVTALNFASNGQRSRKRGDETSLPCLGRRDGKEHSHGRETQDDVASDKESNGCLDECSRIVDIAVSFGISEVDGTDDGEDESNHDEELDQADQARRDSH
ncbi:hypothetical protein VE04_00670 [Pseudogymnoascus sp. 24MN13]|nr:hypothetical protein VE04_00670 [Pseudogymnoascus sp. 24MN13]